MKKFPSPISWWFHKHLGINWLSAFREESEQTHIHKQTHFICYYRELGGLKHMVHVPVFFHISIHNSLQLFHIKYTGNWPHFRIQWNSLLLLSTPNKSTYKCTNELGERGGLVVEPETPEQEVWGSTPH